MAFHPYAQLIPEIFNSHEFGPPCGVTRTSTWPCVDHPASGYNTRNLVARFGLAFAPAPPIGLALLRILSRRIMMQKVRPRTCFRVVLGLLVDMRFQVLLTPLTGVLFTFPSRYLFTIGRQGVFSLTRWSWQIQTGLLVSRPTWVPRSAPSRFRVRDYHALWSAFPGSSANNQKSYRGPATPMPLS